MSSKYSRSSPSSASAFADHLIIGLKQKLIAYPADVVFIDREDLAGSGNPLAKEHSKFFTTFQRFQGTGRLFSYVRPLLTL